MDPPDKHLSRTWKRIGPASVTGVQDWLHVVRSVLLWPHTPAPTTRSGPLFVTILVDWRDAKSTPRRADRLHLYTCRECPECPQSVELELARNGHLQSHPSRHDNGRRKRRAPSGLQHYWHSRSSTRNPLVRTQAEAESAHTAMQAIVATAKLIVPHIQ